MVARFAHSNINIASSITQDIFCGCFIITSDNMGLFYKGIMNCFMILKLLLDHVSELELRITMKTYLQDFIIQEFVCSM
jgi:hypothetical protein